MSAQTGAISTREWRVSERPGAYDELRLHTAEIGTLGATDVLVKVHAFSLHRRDIAVSKGRDPLTIRPSVVLASDAAGDVVSVGSDVSKWRPGDRVYGKFNILHIHGELDKTIEEVALGAGVDGVLSTYKVFPSKALVKIPDHLSYAEASTLPCAALTAYNALLGGPRPLKSGDTVLIKGTGGVALFALQFALASGATPIVLANSAEKIAAVRHLGAEHVINVKKFSEWQHEVLRMTSGVGVDLVFEVAGGKSLERSMKITRHGGTISGIGFVADKDTSPDVFLPTVIKGVNIRGVSNGSRAQLEDMNRLIAATKLRPIINKTFSFENAAHALRYLESQQHVGKVVIEVGRIERVE